MEMAKTTSIVLLLVLPMVLSECPPVYPHCRLVQQQWRVGVDRLRPSGVVVHGHANTPSLNGVQGSVHGSHVVGGPHNGAQTVGGGVNFQGNGLHGGVDATHVRGQGNSLSASVGGSTKLGPGTLSVGGGAGMAPGSSKVQEQVGATYSIP